MKEYKFKIFRFDPDKDKRPYYKSYKVPYEQGMTVLDGLFYIQKYIDGSIAFRSSCREGVCGSCAMHINGKYRLACETQLKDLKCSTVCLGPLRHLEVIRDLVVDFKLFWKKYNQIEPYLMPGKTLGKREQIQTIEERKNIDKLVDCILCGACYASCMMTETDKDYIGPTALLKTCRFVCDSRDNNLKPRLESVSGDHGVFRCHTMYNCKEVCPKEIDPTGAIAELKRKIIKEKYCKNKDK